jgi:hypothetical protein
MADEDGRTGAFTRSGALGDPRRKWRPNLLHGVLLEEKPRSRFGEPRQLLLQWAAEEPSEFTLRNPRRRLFADGA